MSSRVVAATFAASLLLAQGAVVPCPAASDSARERLDRSLAKVVKLFGAGGVRNLEAYGSGFVVSASGHVVTVWSHLLDTGNVSVILNDGRHCAAKFLKGDPNLDLVLLKIEGEDRDFPYFDLREVVDAPPGTRVLGLSNMFKVATGDEPVSVVHGVIAARSRIAARRGAFGSSFDFPVYIIDAITNNPGAAGGALTTLDGRLIGMIGRELRNSQSNTWVNYAIPASELRGPIQEMIAGRFTASPSKPPAGDPRFVPLDLGLVMVPDVVYRTPAYVEEVLPHSPAAEAGILAEDLVVFINDDLVQSNRTLKGILARLEPGDAVRVVVRRKEKLLTLELRIPNRRGK